ncbi:MAG TPA: flagellar filament capping protein FliD [Methylomirabilota bacterium]|nr:flagellar filament capping protein FliD [Methylomirabilota bacterium]
MDLGVSGLASGFDWKTLVDQLIDVERVPQKRLLAEQNQLEQRNNAFGSIKTELTILKSRVEALQEGSLFDSRAATTSDSSVATVGAASGAPLGTFSFDIEQLATAARQVGSSDIGKRLSETSDVSGVVLGTAGLGRTIVGGVITINGAQVTIDATDTLQEVFDNISAATAGVVTGSYDPTTDKVQLTSSTGTLTLGAANDTSNFLLAAGLHNNGSGTVESATSLSRVRPTAALASANFSTTVTDGGSGTGAFKINGVEITFNASTDTLNSVIDKINASSAGVSARYDVQADQLILTNKTTGDVGIALEDVTGNFLAATGVTTGTLERGSNLLYRINGGDVQQSLSNTITESSSGLAGLSVTALAEGVVNVTVSQDSSKVKTAITNFIEAFNKVQTLIENQTASSTDAKGKVTAGLLSGESLASDIASELRSASFASVSGLPAQLDHLADIGIVTDGNSNKLTLDDESLLDEALATNLSGVKALFASSASGLANQLDDYLEEVVGEEGSLVAKQLALTEQAAEIDTQVADLERHVQSRREQLLASFLAMETAQAKINQQLQFLNQKFGGTAQSSSK